MARLLRTAAISAVVAAAAVAAAGASEGRHFLAALGMTHPERTTIEAGGCAFTVLPARGRDLAVAGVTRTDAGAARLAAWSRDVERLYRGRYMPAVGRLSNPPRIEDLAELTLEDEDLADLRKCRAGACGVKLGAREIEEIRQAAAAAGPQWKPAVQRAFREAVLARAQAYLQSGFATTPAYHDHKTPVRPDAEFDEIAARFEPPPVPVPHVFAYLRDYPRPTGAPDDSFLYWSKETLGAGKPIVSLTHVAIFTGRDAAGATTVVAARQVYATHYLTGSLSLTLLTEGAEPAGYLMYLRRSRTDAFEGAFGKLVRSIVERRVRAEAPPVLDALRRKLEESSGKWKVESGK